MKRTTYIILGVFFAILAAHMVLVYVIINHTSLQGHISFVERKEDKLPEGKTVLVQMKYENDEYQLAGRVNVSAALENETCRFEYPEKMDGYIAFENRQDTLNLVIDMDRFLADTEGEKTGIKKGHITVGDLVFDLHLTQEVESLLSESPDLRWSFSNISLASLQIKTGKKVELSSCKIDSLSLSCRGADAESVEIGGMHLELENKRIFELSSGEIDRLFCTAAGKTTIRNEGVIRHVAWEPKDEESRLNIEFKTRNQIGLSDK